MRPLQPRGGGTIILEPNPPELFTFEADTVIAQEDVASPEPFPQAEPSPSLSPEPEPSAPAPMPNQSTSQDPSSTLMLDLNEHAEDHSQDD